MCRLFVRALSLVTSAHTTKAPREAEGSTMGGQQIKMARHRALIIHFSVDFMSRCYQTSAADCSLADALAVTCRKPLLYHLYHV